MPRRVRRRVSHVLTRDLSFTEITPVVRDKSDARIDLVAWFEVCFIRDDDVICFIYMLELYFLVVLRVRAHTLARARACVCERETGRREPRSCVWSFLSKNARARARARLGTPRDASGDDAATLVRERVLFALLFADVVHGQLLDVLRELGEGCAGLRGRFERWPRTRRRGRRAHGRSQRLSRAET